jgi:predicted transposase YbfD/YdcC
MTVSHAVTKESSAEHEGEDLTIASLLTMLGKLTDPRKRRGKRYTLVFILACAVIAVLAGACTYRQIASQARDLPQSLLAILGARYSWFLRRYTAPSAATLRRVLGSIDAAALDLLIGSWLWDRAHRDLDGVLAVAIDGKVLRGAWTSDNHQVTLFSAMIHGQGVTVAQVRVPDGTTETTQIQALLDQIPSPTHTTVVVTADSAHTCRDTAEHITTRKFDYLLAVKGNQPALHQQILDRFRPLVITPPAHLVEERSHGRITRWSTWMAEATGIDFPHAAQLGCVRRDEFTLGEVAISKEFAFLITSSPASQTSPADLHTYARGHWGIENKSHHVRDTTWREDDHQAWVGNGPHTLATLRNLAQGLFRLHGIHKIKEGTEAICRDRLRALPLLAT